MKLTMAPGDSESYYTSSLNFFIKKNNPHIIGSVVDILHSIQSVEYIVQEKMYLYITDSLYIRNSITKHLLIYQYQQPHSGFNFANNTNSLIFISYFQPPVIPDLSEPSPSLYLQFLKLVFLPCIFPSWSCLKKA